jgi:hypothetical protein
VQLGLPEVLRYELLHGGATNRLAVVHVDDYWGCSGDDFRRLLRRSGAVAHFETPQKEAAERSSTDTHFSGGNFTPYKHKQWYQRKKIQNSLKTGFILDFDEEAPPDYHTAVNLPSPDPVPTYEEATAEK